MDAFANGVTRLVGRFVRDMVIQSLCFVTQLVVIAFVALAILAGIALMPVKKADTGTTQLVIPCEQHWSVWTWKTSTSCTVMGVKVEISE